jgi:hypothetical protein
VDVAGWSLRGERTRESRMKELATTAKAARARLHRRRDRAWVAMVGRISLIISLDRPMRGLDLPKFFHMMDMGAPRLRRGVR